MILLFHQKCDKKRFLDFQFPVGRKGTITWWRQKGFLGITNCQVVRYTQQLKDTIIVISNFLICLDFICSDIFKTKNLFTNDRVGTNLKPESDLTFIGFGTKITMYNRLG